MTAKTNASDWVGTFRAELAAFWRALPDKALFAVLVAAWVALFHFVGTSNFGWVKSPSMFAWMRYVFTTSADDSYCQLIPLIVLGLFWWKRKELIAVPKIIWWPALTIVMAGLLLHVLGYMAQQIRISIVAFVIGIYGLMGLVWGRAWLKASVFPYFLMLFCVPLGAMADEITLPLRILASKITGVVGALIGIQVVQDGTRIYNAVQGYAYEVAAACSGLNSLIAFIGLTAIYGFVCFPHGWRRALIISAGPPLALACNVLRLTCIVIAAESFGQSAGNFVHEKLGLIFYVPGFIALIFLGNWLEKRQAKQVRQGALQAAAKPA